MFIASWDLDKTYLRTDFDTLRDLVRTAVERPDQKRTVPGAATLMRELGDAGVQVHILSGSPEQLRGRIVEKLRLDGVRYVSLTLKPNLRNILRLRFRALRGQLGYKLPALLRRRCELVSQRDDEGELIHEALLGDDAEADAFVYSLYADICAGEVDERLISEIMRKDNCYDDNIETVVRLASYVQPGLVVERILIHLERQSSPSSFEHFGPRVVPFYNYMQAAFVLYEDSRLSPSAVLRVAQDMAGRHHFDGGALARSYMELARRGHVGGHGIGALCAEFEAMIGNPRIAAASELREMISDLEQQAPEIPPPGSQPLVELDYLELVGRHNRRKKRR